MNMKYYQIQKTYFISVSPFGYVGNPSLLILLVAFLEGELHSEFCG